MTNTLLYPDSFLILIITLVILLLCVITGILKGIKFNIIHQIIVITIGIVLSLTTLFIARQDYSGTNLITSYGYPHSACSSSTSIETLGSNYDSKKYLYFEIPTNCNINYSYLIVNILIFISITELIYLIAKRSMEVVDLQKDTAPKATIVN